MKRLLSILLALAMVMTFALPAMAADEPTYDVQITSDIRIDEMYRTTGDGHYLWEEYGRFDAIVAGQELKNITVIQLRNAIYEALDIVRRRREWQEWNKNPLEHFEREKGRDISIKDLAEHEQND